MQGLSSALYDVETAVQILIRGNSGDELRPECAGDRFDGGKRIVDFVAKHTDEALPCLPLLFPQGGADIRQEQESMGHAALAKRTAVHHPAGTAAVLLQFNN